MDFKQWNTFNKGEWTHEIDVRDFIQKNYTPYTGDESFLSGATERTLKLSLIAFRTNSISVSYRHTTLKPTISVM